jgi:hypothetical protein
MLLAVVWAAASYGASAPTLQDILAKAKAALGGAARLDGVRTIALTASRVQSGAVVEAGEEAGSGEDGIRQKIQLTFQFPLNFRREEQMNGSSGTPGPIEITCLNGERVWSDERQPDNLPQGWMVHYQSFRSAPADQTKILKFTAARYLFALMLRSGPAFPLSITYVGTRDSSGETVDVIEGKGPEDFRARLYLDQKTGLPKLLKYAAFEWILSDYRSLEGLQFPFHITINRNGKMLSETMVERYAINPVLDQTFFEK